MTTTCVCVYVAFHSRFLVVFCKERFDDQNSLGFYLRKMLTFLPNLWPWNLILNSKKICFCLLHDADAAELMVTLVIGSSTRFGPVRTHWSKFMGDLMKYGGLNIFLVEVKKY